MQCRCPHLTALTIFPPPLFPIPVIVCTLAPRLMMVGTETTIFPPAVMSGSHVLVAELSIGYVATIEAMVATMVLAPTCPYLIGTVSPNPTWTPTHHTAQSRRANPSREARSPPSSRSSKRSSKPLSADTSSDSNWVDNDRGDLWFWVCISRKIPVQAFAIKTPRLHYH